MSEPRTVQPTEPPPIRLWPGVVAATLLCLVWLGVPRVVPGFTAALIGVVGGMIGALLVLVWWAFFSRTPQAERWGIIGWMVVAVVASFRLSHASVTTAGMGAGFFIYCVPSVSLALVAGAVASRSASTGRRRLTMVLAILVACGMWTLFRSDGASGEGSDLAWRWSATAEERLLANAANEAGSGSVSEPAEVEADWPGFRGHNRDGRVGGVRISTDWAKAPPVELWRRAVGPGWSSFAVGGDYLYTQEQRGDEEIVACYRASTGEPVWSHRDETRFWESNAGAGPRATPTLRDGRVYALGATGLLNALDAGDGRSLWRRDAASDTGAAVPYWGFAGSPLVTDDLVVVATSGTLAAYDLASGELRWRGPIGKESYSSPHLLVVEGMAQILLMSGPGLTSASPVDGTLLWQHQWPGSSIVLPALTADGDVLVAALAASGGAGMRRLEVAHEPVAGWTVAERWTSNRLKPYFNDFVVHDGNAYGFDGAILASIDLESGARNWKGGRYGYGQLILLPEQDVLLVLSEKGELALVEATPERFTELARFSAFSSKSWNHPVLVRDLLLVRNDREIAAFRLSLAGG